MGTGRIARTGPPQADVECSERDDVAGYRLSGLTVAILALAIASGATPAGPPRALSNSSSTCPGIGGARDVFYVGPLRPPSLRRHGYVS